MKQEKPSLSVIVCTYNRAGYLEDTLRDLAHQSLPAGALEVVVVDNNSTDNTRKVCEHARHEFPVLRLHYVKEPQQGLSYARNRGADSSIADLIAYIDDDVFVDSNWGAAMLAGFDRFPDAIAAGGRIVVHFESDPPPWISSYLMPLLGEHSLGARVRNYPSGKYPLGGNMIFRRSVFARFGYFDPTLGRSGGNLMGSEEKEFFWRMRGERNRIYFLPDAVVHHRVDGRRFTHAFVREQALGVGRSERARMKRAGLLPLVSKIVSEVGKTLVSLGIAAGFMARAERERAAMLLKFRYWVACGLLGK